MKKDKLEEVKHEMMKKKGKKPKDKLDEVKMMYMTRMKKGKK